MLADAEKYKNEDDKQKEKIAARNQLEGYLFSAKQVNIIISYDPNET